MTMICPCGRTVRFRGNGKATCKCGRSFSVQVKVPTNQRRKARRSLKKSAGQTFKQLQGLLMSAAFVLLLLTAVALISIAGR